MKLIDLLGLGKLIIDIEKKTIELNFLGFSIKGIKYSWIKELKKDQYNTEKLISELFIRKQVMWRDFAREKVDYCLLSLEDLKIKCDKESEKFYATKKDKDILFASLLKHWGNECDFAIKELRTAKDNEKLSRGEMDSNEFMPVVEEIPKIIGTFRAKTLPIVKELCELLPENSLIKKEAENNLNEAINIIIKFYNIRSEEIQEGQYEII